jgi:predicted PurR-regulated permease PerM
VGVDEADDVPRWLSRAAGWSWRLIVVVAAIALAVTVLLFLRTIVLPLLFALLLSVYLLPVVHWLRAHRAPRPVAAVIGLFIVLLTGAGITALAVYAIADESDVIREQVEDGVDELERLAEDEFGADRVEDFRTSVEQGVSRLGEVGVEGAMTVVSTAVEIVTGAVLTLFALYYVMRDGDRWWDRFTRQFGAARRSFLQRAGANAWVQVKGYMYGTAVIAAVDAVLIGVGALVLSVPSVLAIALLTFFAAFVPYLGAVVAGLFATLLALADGGLGRAALMLAVVIAVQQVEGTILQPIIQSRFVALHPLAIILAVTAGGVLGGLVGMLIAVPLTAVALSVYNDLQEVGYFEHGELPS